ncbi:MAG: nitrile hydratase accessory protein [Pseudomonadota bacterium]
MFSPDDPLAPPSGVFAEPWHATVLAMATAMIRQGHFTQSDWAEALGAALRSAETENAPETDETYFSAALSALETLTEGAGISEADRSGRKSDWEDAYRRTPHGQPVEI